MKGLELNVTKQNGMTLVEYQLGVADVYDDRVSDKVAQLGNIIPFQYKDEDGKRSIVSYVHHDTSLEVMLRQTLKKADVLAILKGLLCAFEIGAAGVQICYLVRDLNYIYVDPESKAVKCIMVPVKQDPLGQSDIPDFFRNIVSHMRFDEADKDDYVARILTLINTDHYSNMKLKGLVDAEMEKLGLFYTRDEGLKKEADTTAAPEVQNQNVKVNRVGVMNNMRPQGMPAMGQPVPPMGRQPMGQPVPPMGRQPMMGQPVPPMGRQPMGQPVPPMGGQPMMGQPVPPMNGQPMGQPVPTMGGQPMGQPIPPMGQMPKPEMPKPQAPAPEAPKPEMPKPEMPKPQAPVPEAPKPEMPKPEMPKPQAPAPEAPKPEMPKPEMPKPQAPAPEAPKPEIPKPEMPKPQMPPMGQRPAMGGQPMMGQPVPPMGGQPMMGQPVPPMGGQRPPMGQPMMGQPMMGQMPRPQAPQMQNGNLMGQLGGARPIPHFVRKSTGEIINITKPEFIIGKSKTKADYAIENNSAISREHCIVIQRDGVNYIKDNNSTNHTYVNGVELQPGKEVLLKHKTEVRLGDEEFTFLLRKGE